MPRSKSKKAEKPKKPRVDFPLTPHDNGRWCKRIKVRMHYFGEWAKTRTAL